MPLIRRSTYPKGPLSRDVRGETAARRKRARRAWSTTTRSCRTSARRRWDEALDLVARRLKEIHDRDGPGAIAGFGSAKCSNEEAYLFQKLIRAGFGTNNVDHCTRLCHASSVAALLEGVGSGAVSTTYGDIANADVAIITGTNTTANHPVAVLVLQAGAPARHEAHRRRPARASGSPSTPTSTASSSPAPTWRSTTASCTRSSGSGLIDREFIAARMSQLRRAGPARHASTRRSAPRRSAASTPTTIREVARLWGEAGAGVIYWGMGISQHTTGTDNARCLIALCSITGNVGKPGTGLHPLRGQNNVQGASDAGLIPMFYPDYQRVDNDGTRASSSSRPGAGRSTRSRGLTVTEIIGTALKGGVRGMYMLGENPFLSDPNINKVRKALAALDFLVVQDIFLTETAEFADVILPGDLVPGEGRHLHEHRPARAARPQGDRPARPGPRGLGDRPGHRQPDRAATGLLARRARSSTRWSRSCRRTANLRLREPRPDRQALPERGPRAHRRHGRHVRRAVQHRRRAGPPGAGAVAAGQGAAGRRVPAGAQHRPAARALAHRLDDPPSFALDTISPTPRSTCTRRTRPTAGWRTADGPGRLPARVDRAAGAVSHREQLGNCFIPFHFREAAANLLTIDEIDPFGKIPSSSSAPSRSSRWECGHDAQLGAGIRSRHGTRPRARGRGPGREVPRARR